MKKIFLGVLLVFSISSLQAQENKLTVSSNLKSALIYASGAELQHAASANLKKGTTELTLTDVGNSLDINSIRMNAPGTVTILSVEFSNTFVAPTEKTGRLKMLEDSLTNLEKELQRIDFSYKNISELLKVLQNNSSIKGEQTGMSVAELMKFMDYYKSKSTELQKEQMQWESKKVAVQKQILVVRKEFNEELKKNANTGGRLIVRLSSAVEAKADFSFSYITPNAYWTPSYDLRVENLRSPIQAKLKAKIWQSTGIDWKKVKLSLSTSTPSQYGMAPVLSQWFLQYMNLYPLYARQNTIQAYSKDADGYYMVEEVAEAPSESRILDKKKSVGKSYVAPIYVVNGEVMDAGTYGTIDHSLILSSTYVEPSEAEEYYGSQAAGGAYVIELKNSVSDYTSVAENTLNTVFEIDLPYDVPCNGKPQSIDITTKDITTKYKYYAVPKLSSEVYLLGEIPNWSSLNLLSGEASIILENTYVGKTFLESRSANDTLNLTIGNDKRVSVKRQKIEDFSSTKFMNSNKIQKFTYEITIKNNKTEAIQLQLKDQYPLSTNKEVEVELVDAGNATINKELGVLTWYLDVAANESKKVRFTYTVKYPKDKVLNLE